MLVVDDYRPFADLLAKTLHGKGLDARATYNAAEAVRLAEELKPHALIADARLSDMDGWTLGVQVGRRFPSCRILLVSADIYLHRRPADAPNYKLVQKSTVLDELPQLLGPWTGSGGIQPPNF